MNKKINYSCPCGGKIKWLRDKVVQEGVNCGTLDVEICNKCGNQYLPDWSMEIVENKLKNEGLWEKPKSDDLKRFKKIEERMNKSIGIRTFNQKNAIKYLRNL